MEKSMKDIHGFRLKDLAASNYIPFLGGRPERNTPICSPEIIDLKIDLWTTPSVELFLKKIN
jgi:hypothetical protein